MSTPHYFTTPGGSVSIDLGKVFAGYTSSPNYSSSAAVNGTLTISGKTATFKATACGPASFNVTVKDGDGANKTVDMVVFVDAASGGSCP